SSSPYFTIFPIGTYPDPYTIALQGVETGSMKPRLAPNVAPSAGSSGSTPALCASAITTGTTMFADAVFDVVSDTSTATIVATINMPKLLPCIGIKLVRPSPTDFASPVLNDNTPSANPPPYSRTTPQSIFTASCQLMARPSRSPGKKKSKHA